MAPLILSWSSKDHGMRKRSEILTIDGVANLLFGAFLLLAPRGAFEILGLPWTERALWALILGGVLFGVGVALLLESRRPQGGIVGLGLGGAVAINLGGAAGILLWLFLGAGEIPLKGRALLGVLVAFLVGLSSFELLVSRRSHTGR